MGTSISRITLLALTFWVVGCAQSTGIKTATPNVVIHQPVPSPSEPTVTSPTLPTRTPQPLPSYTLTPSPTATLAPQPLPSYTLSPNPVPTVIIDPVHSTTLAGAQVVAYDLVQVPLPSPQLPICQSSAGSCGFNYSGGYASGTQKMCRITYSRPNTNYATYRSVIFFTNCGTCRDGALRAPNSVESPIAVSSDLRCSGSALLDQSWQTRHSYRVDTLSGSACTKESQWFTFNLSQCHP